MADSTLTVVAVYPRLLGTYGDGGNVAILAHRARARGVEVTVVAVGPGERLPRQAEVYLLGGGEDDGQTAATRALAADRGLHEAADRGAVVMAVCAGLQMLGRRFDVGGGGTVEGLGLLDVVTRRREVRAVGEVLAEPDPRLGLPTLTGYENHGGGTYLGADAVPLASVQAGVGNGGTVGTEGAWNGGRVIGTYLHGPVFARNPALADLVICWSTGLDLAPLAWPYADNLRAERITAVRAGQQSPAAHSRPGLRSVLRRRRSR